MTYSARRLALFGFVSFNIALAAGVLVHAGGQDAAVANDGLNKPRFTFALWGDVMYTPADFDKLPALTADINASKAAFSIYDGDIKSGSSVCSDDVFGRAIGYFNAFENPVIYVPGDNEWTDCHRINNGGYKNLDRLRVLREQMFSSPNSFGQRTLPLEHQGELGQKYSENTRWTYGDVVFVTLNIPGSNNNKVNGADCTNKSARTAEDCALDNAEYAERDGKNIEFLKSSFALAKMKGALGLVVVMQADPSFDAAQTEDVNERTCIRPFNSQCLVDPFKDHPIDPTRAGYDGYTSFLDALTAETKNFTGHVLLVHGDTHFFTIDQPLTDQAHLIPNLTRVQTFGSPNVNWVEVTVDPKDRPLFTARPMIVP